VSALGPAAGLLAAAQRSAPVTHLGERLVATVVLALLVFGTFAAMRRGWRRRARLHADLPSLPPLGPDSGQGEPAGAPSPLVGRYYGSTMAGAWLDRVVAHGLGTRSAVELCWTSAGIAVHRPAATSFLIPAGALVDARLDRTIAGAAPPPGGLLVLTWRHGGRILDSGFRADRVAEHAAWVEAVARQVGATDHATAGAPAGVDENLRES
jgi:hypothetical protein